MVVTVLSKSELRFQSISRKNLWRLTYVIFLPCIRQYIMKWQVFTETQRTHFQKKKLLAENYKTYLVQSVEPGDVKISIETCSSFMYIHTYLTTVKLCRL